MNKDKSYDDWKLTGTCGGKTYSINSPSSSTHIIFDGSSKVTINIAGSFSYTKSAAWYIGRVTFSPFSITYEDGEYGIKQFDASCYEN